LEYKFDDDDYDDGVCGLPLSSIFRDLTEKRHYVGSFEIIIET